MTPLAFVRHPSQFLLKPFPLSWPLTILVSLGQKGSVRECLLVAGSMQIEPNPKKSGRSQLKVFLCNLLTDLTSWPEAIGLFPAALLVEWKLDAIFI